MPLSKIKSIAKLDTSHPAGEGGNGAPDTPSVLLTGFDSFGGDDCNPSWLAVQQLGGASIAGHRVIAAQLPTSFAESTPQLLRLMRLYMPDLVICTGLAANRQAISLERIAINISDARIADNCGAQPVDMPVVSGGPAAFFSTLPIKAMLVALRDNGVAAEVSQSAGTFVCNHVFYTLMHELASRPAYLAAGARGGFIHVPCIPGHAEPSMPLAEIVRGLELALACALTTRTDLAIGAGSTA